MSVNRYYTDEVLKEHYEKTIYPMIQKIKELGGIIDESAVPTLEHVLRLRDTESPLNTQYLGSPSLSDVVQRAIECANDKAKCPSSEDTPPYFLNLSRALGRQATPRSLTVLRSNAISYDPSVLLGRSLEFAHKYELPLYSKHSTTREVRGHITGYFRKFGHMSDYYPDK